MGTGELIPRLMAQVGSASFGMALAKKNGFINTAGGLSAKGMERNNMNAEQRALDRDNDGRLRKYNGLTNRTTLAQTMGKLIIKLGEKILMFENFLKRKWNSFVSMLQFKTTK